MPKQCNAQGSWGRIIVAAGSIGFSMLMWYASLAANSIASISSIQVWWSNGETIILCRTWISLQLDIWALTWISEYEQWPEKFCGHTLTETKYSILYKLAVVVKPATACNGNAGLPRDKNPSPSRSSFAGNMRLTVVIYPFSGSFCDITSFFEISLFIFVVGSSPSWL